jgi:hypothetical protein
LLVSMSEYFDILRLNNYQRNVDLEQFFFYAKIFFVPGRTESGLQRVDCS